MQTSFPPCAVTRLSGVAAVPGKLRRAFGLARRSLVLGALSMLSGCLVEDPPPYTPPTRTAPRLDTRRAEPLQNNIVIVDKGDPIVFRVPVVSEDAGEPVQALLFVDSFPFNVNSDVVPASTLDDLSRRFELSYNGVPVIDYGCHRMMVRVSHQSNFNFQTDAGVPIDENDVADAYWWINVVDLAGGDDGAVLRNCAGNAGGLK
jgi:hypothetical protein